MSQLKEQNGKYYQQCKVVMLATEKSNLVVYNSKLELVRDKDRSTDFNGNPQHLYILSDEEVKEGDWFINLHDNSMHQLKDGKLPTINKCKKIIATTDTSLGLPQPSQSFIKKYIEEYNKGNVIEDVLVEHEIETDFSYEYGYKLKVDLDNTITIKKVKDSYTREELEKLCIGAAYYAFNKASLAPSDITKWLKEKL